MSVVRRGNEGGKLVEEGPRVSHCAWIYQVVYETLRLLECPDPSLGVGLCKLMAEVGQAVGRVGYELLVPHGRYVFYRLYIDFSTLPYT